MKTITSRQNPEVMGVAALATTKGRHHQHKFIAEGLRACSSLAQSQIKLLQLYVIEALVPDAVKIAPQELITVVHDTVMEKMSQTTTPSGMLGVFRIPMQPGAKNLEAGLVLANITDPGNMGTLIRTCAALKVKSVVVVEGVDPWSPKVVQATAGTIGEVDIFSYSWQDFLKNKGSKLKLQALAIAGGMVPSHVHKHSLLVVGNEAHGILPEWLAACDDTLTIPMPGAAESLNAAVAGSIALYLVHGG
jgi:TrmH family RNA methyltransferase